MPPTLLHVCPTFAVGGQQTRLATIANRLGQQFRHRLVSLDGRYEAVDLLDPILDFTIVQVETPVRDLRNILKLNTRIDADILVTYNWGSIDWVISNSFIF